MIKLDLIQTVACGGLVLLLGRALQRFIPVLARYNLPGPVLGGMLVAAVLAVLKTQGITPLVFDTTLQTPLMIAFFTSLGFGASVSMLRVGGPQVFLFLGACTVLAVGQNLLGMAVASLMGLPPLFGVLAGSVTLTGGPGTGLAFAPAFEAAGVASASVVAVTCATGGIVMGGLFGAPVGTRLIERFGLKPAARVTPETHLEAQTEPEDGASALTRHLIAVLACMWLGTYVSGWLTNTGVTLPAYIGAMLVAAVVRNVDDVTRIFRLRPALLDDLGNVALSFFLALSLMTLKLWELASLALPMVVILAAQTAFMVTVASTVMFRVMGRDYDAAVMSGGLVGFMMGTTANAMANMESLARRYGAAPRAFLVVPMVGACFIDFTNSVLITAFLNALK